MPKIIYFDCAGGICGNMTLGALLEICGDEEYFLNELAKLGLDGYEIRIEKRESYGIRGTYVNVLIDGEDEYGHHHDIGHDHHHAERNLNDILSLINNSDLRQSVKEISANIFMKLAKAEAKIHDKDIDKVHFHEVGARDSIIDIVGTAILIDRISPDLILSSTVNEGHGFIECAHGKMSVPVPATSQIFADSNIQVRQIDVNTELVTPTGAAIISTLASDFTLMPEMKIQKTAFGLGSKDIGYTNALKVYLGEGSENNDDIYVVETNIDDSTGEQMAYAMEQVLKAGARDAFYTPVIMKKGRPAYKLEIICTKDKLDDLLEIVFKETTTIGVRYHKVERTELKREMICVDTEYGKVQCKKVTSPKGQVYIYPEYEDIKKIAIEKNIPLKELYKLF